MFATPATRQHSELGFLLLNLQVEFRTCVCNFVYFVFQWLSFTSQLRRSHARFEARINERLPEEEKKYTERTYKHTKNIYIYLYI